MSDRPRAPSDPHAHRRSLAGAQAEAALAPGVVVAGRYLVERRVGGGAVGEVWLASHVEMGLRVAIKQLSTSEENAREAVPRFRREAQVLARVRSENVARIVDFLVDPTYGLLLVLEFIDGEPLSALLAKRTLSVEDAIELAGHVTNALAELHRARIAHRDVKPSNLLLEPRPDGAWRAVLVDFGASRLVAAPDEEVMEDALTSITQVDMAIGTLEYMAPEQVLSSATVTPACDVYALGAILYRAVTGRHVFGSVSEGKLVLAKMSEDAPRLDTGRNDPLARQLEAFVARALRRDLDQRFRDGQEMAEALKPMLDWIRATGFEDAPTDPGIELAFETMPAPGSSRSGMPRPSSSRRAAALLGAMPPPTDLTAPLAPAPPLALPARGPSPIAIAFAIVLGLGGLAVVAAALWVLVAKRH